LESVELKLIQELKIRLDMLQLHSIDLACQDSIEDWFSRATMALSVTTSVTEATLDVALHAWKLRGCLPPMVIHRKYVFDDFQLPQDGENSLVTELGAVRSMVSLVNLFILFSARSLCEM
jgi:hypothetical protein